MSKTSHAWRRFAAGLVACAGLLLVPAAALAEVRSGNGTDPAGDAPFPQADVTAVGFAYDTQGSFVGKVTLAAAPAAGRAVVVTFAFGKLVGAKCDRGAGAWATVPAGPSGALLIPSNQSLNPPGVKVEGNVVTMAVADPRIANRPWDCAVGGTVRSDPGQQVLDAIGVVPIQAPTLPPSPAPVPPPATQPPPATTPPPPPAAKPKSSAKLRRAIRSCQRKHRGSKRSSKRARKRCIARARKRHGQR